MHRFLALYFLLALESHLRAGDWFLRTENQEIDSELFIPGGFSSVKAKALAEDYFVRERTPRARHFAIDGYHGQAYLGAMILKYFT